jgi:2-keto-3-deoxy-L-rhamnonate aldolase RhmA
MTVSARDLLRNGLKEKLARGEVAASMIVKLVRTIEIAQIAKTAGFDTFYLDNEHNSFSLETTSQICMAALAVGITPLVRVPSCAPEYISRVLDGGALGVIAPHVQSAREAEQVVRAAKFPPFGERGMTGALAQLQFRIFSAAETIEAVNDATMVVVMIETAEALAHVNEIAAVPGVDLLMIGTNDLCAALGIPGQHDHKLIRDAYMRGIEACSKHGKYLGVGGLANHPKLVSQFVELGARYVSIGNDLSFLMSAASAKARQVQELRPREVKG